MSELRPILDEDPTDGERRLLASAHLDAPPPQAKRRALAALGFAAVTTSAATGAAAGSLVVLKTIAIGAIGSALVVGAVTEARRMSRAEGPAAVRAPSVVAAVAPPRLVEAKVAPPVVVPVVPAVAPIESPVVETAPRAPAVHRAIVAPPVSAEAPPPSPLASELRALDEARRSLAAGDGAASLLQLDAFHQRFPRPMLAIEASVLRIESLVSLGRTGEAKAQAAELLQAQPEGPYAQRVRSILAASR